MVTRKFSVMIGTLLYVFRSFECYSISRLPFETDTKGNTLLCWHFCKLSNRQNWYTKLLDTWKVAQLSLLYQKKVKSSVISEIWSPNKNSTCPTVLSHFSPLSMVKLVFKCYFCLFNCFSQCQVTLKKKKKITDKRCIAQWLLITSRRDRILHW